MRTITVSLLIITVGILIIYDIIVAVNKEEGDTITEVVQRAPKWITFLLGFVCGHLFW